MGLDLEHPVPRPGPSDPSGCPLDKPNPAPGGEALLEGCTQSWVSGAEPSIPDCHCCFWAFGEQGPRPTGLSPGTRGGATSPWQGQSPPDWASCSCESSLKEACAGRRTKPSKHIFLFSPLSSLEKWRGLWLHFPNEVLDSEGQMVCLRSHGAFFSHQP